MVYMDNIIVHTTVEESLEDHQKKVYKVLDHLKEHDLYLHPLKCSFKQSEMTFLGIIISYKSIAMDPKKLNTIANWKALKNVRGVQRFLSFTGFYQHFITSYSKIV